MLKELPIIINMSVVGKKTSKKTDPHLNLTINFYWKAAVSSKWLQEKDKSIILWQKIISRELWLLIL